jgi:hypothetical protein
MDLTSLRTLLLVKAVEESDQAGAILPVADRDAATRAALRSLPPPPDAPSGRAPRIEHAQRVAVERARELYRQLAQRHPVIARTVLLESTLVRSAWLLLVLALVLGLLLSIADSRVRIDIVAFPLIGLIAWNLLVYLVLLVRALGRIRASDAGSRSTGWIAISARWGWRRATKLIKEADFYHRPLSAALRRFSDEWWVAAQPMLVQQGQRLFHFAAAAVAVGLVAGFYIRGIGLEYRAGWESTFLGPEQVRDLIVYLYGPASLVTGIALPDSLQQVEALHWRGGAGGGPAAPWIHLMSATALLLVIIPRLLLGSLAGLAAWRASRFVTPPESLVPYMRRVLAASDAALPADTIAIVPYAYQPTSASLRGAERVLHAVFGADARIEFATAVAYGEEDSLAARLAMADVSVLLLSLAATPEAENHGAVLGAIRAHVTRAGASARLLVLIDETPFLQRMQGDGGLERRVDERRRGWLDFVAGHGVTPCLVDLGALAEPAAKIHEATLDQVRAATKGGIPA